jgi:hypothetical protein
MTHHYHASVAYGDDLNDRVNDVVPLELRLMVSDLLDLGPVHVEALQQLQRPLPAGYPPPPRSRPTSPAWDGDRHARMMQWSGV